MSKKLFLLFSLGFLMACSSSPPKDIDQASPPATENDSSLPTDLDSSAKQMESSKPESKSEAARAGQTQRSETGVLGDAIKTESDEAIAKAAVAVLAKNPSDAKALNALGFYHYKKGHYPAAILMLNKALKANPNYAEAHNNLGLTFLAQKEQRDAIKEFKKALEADPNDGIAAANLGALYIESKDYQKALIAMEIAYRKNPKDPKILNNYGIALTANGKYDQARDIYKQALSTSSSNKDIMFNYAVLLIEDLNKKDEGLDLLGKVRFLGPTSEVRNRINILENKAKAGLK